VSQHHLHTHSGVRIPYQLKVSAKRRTIGLRIDANGLTVHTPRRVPQSTLDKLLQDKVDWILRKLSEWQEQPPAFAWCDGATLQYLGNDIRLTLRQDARNRTPTLDGTELVVAQPDPADLAAVKRKVALWYAKEARSDFTRRIELLAAKLGVPTPPVYLSNAKTRWGSCNSRGEIRLHWRLVQAPPHVIHYVVAHELAHLKEMNHSPQFWAWVAKLCPEYEQAKTTLKTLSRTLHLI